MQRGPSVLKVYEVGENTIVGFSRSGAGQPPDIPRWHSELMKLVDQHGCRVLTFDLSGVRRMPSAVLDIMFSLKQRGVLVQVFNPTKTMRDLLKVTRLNGVVREVDQLYAESA
jgi:anti-anti-sigma regulatory factor